ncbi:hypothetical protein EZS27_012095 [termite gut metagenome]|uniref:Uncharacterized protein n=1 Tax=termite gut metagenome TaxID=433724 RepID=A0A5J4S1L1_9ZZZZ
MIISSLFSTKLIEDKEKNQAFNHHLKAFMHL